MVREAVGDDTDGVVRAVSYGLGKGDRPPGRQAGLQGRGVRAGQDITVVVDLREELAESVRQRLKGAVDVQVVRLHVGHERQVGAVLQEGAVVLVRLHDEVLTVSRSGVCAHVARLAADHERWRETCAREDVGHKRRGRHNRRR